MKIDCSGTQVRHLCHSSASHLNNIENSSVFSFSVELHVPLISSSITITPPFQFLGRVDRVFCPKICLFKTDGWHFGTEFLATQKTSISENYRHFKLKNIHLNVLTV